MNRIGLMVSVTLAVAAGQVADADDQTERDVAARAAFEDVYRVLLSPRCKNCHPAGNTPLQGDAGVPHAQNVSRRSTNNGLACSACHRDRNVRATGGPPGAPQWQMPPMEMPMVFEGRTPHELCEQLKDPTQTHGKDLDAMVAHVASDALVRWGWSPGPKRTTPPLTHAQTVTAMRTWVDLGAACPK